MKTCFVTTIKTINTRLPNKSFLHINGKPLYRYLFKTLKSISEVDTYISSSDEEVLKIAQERGFTPLKQPERLNHTSIAGDQLLEWVSTQIDYDLIGWLLITSPFLYKQTILNAIEVMKKGEYDSLIGVIPRYNRFWFDGAPVNHDPSNLIGTQFLIPVYEEADFYFINMKSFKKYKTRVCGKIYNYEVSDIESVDIDTKYDLLIAKTVIEAMEKVHVVGGGSVFRKYVYPALEELYERKLAQLIHVFDPKKLSHNLIEGGSHVYMTASEKIIDYVERYKGGVFILSNPNNFHLRDTLDLVSVGCKVLLEKPYAINLEEHKQLSDLLAKKPKEIFLLDYYLYWKFIPLLYGFGLINKRNLYSIERILKPKDHYFLESQYQSLTELIGDIKSMQINIEESWDVDSNEDKGCFLINKDLGGGVTQDLGIHAISLVFAMKELIGEIPNVEYVGCKHSIGESYIQHVIDEYNISKDSIAESFTEINFFTDKNIAVHIRLKKFSEIKNRNVVIQGLKGSLFLDMTTDNLFYYSPDNNKRCLMGMSDDSSLKYYPLLRYGLDHINHKKSLLENNNDLLMNSQEFILHLINKEDDK